MRLNEVNVFIKERMLTIRAHNTWKEISRESSTRLSQADHFGSFFGDQSV